MGFFKKILKKTVGKVLPKALPIGGKQVAGLANKLIDGKPKTVATAPPALPQNHPFKTALVSGDGYLGGPLVQVGPNLYKRVPAYRPAVYAPVIDFPQT